MGRIDRAGALADDLVAALGVAADLVPRVRALQRALRDAAGALAKAERIAAAMVELLHEDGAAVDAVEQARAARDAIARAIHERKTT